MSNRHFRVRVSESILPWKANPSEMTEMTEMTESGVIHGNPWKSMEIHGILPVCQKPALSSPCRSRNEAFDTPIPLFKTVT